VDVVQAAVEPANNKWPVEDKNVFGPYYTGVDFIYGDPLAIHRRLYQETAGEADLWVRQAWGADPLERCTAIGKLYPAVIAAFRCSAFDVGTGIGLKEDQSLLLLKAFLDWLSKKKESIKK
jgi:hypothetical protein